MTYCVLLALPSHGHWVVDEFIRLGGLRFHIKGVSTCPAFSIDDWSQVPVLIGAVHHLDIFCVTVSDMSAKMNDFLGRGNSHAHPSQGQQEGLPKVNLTLQILSKSN